MAFLLYIETSGEICSVALSENDQKKAVFTSTQKNIHSSHLTHFIDELLRQNQMKIHDLDAVVVNRGPGSFTGLRIGVATAKGICLGASLPLIGVSSLEAMISNIYPSDRDSNLVLCPLIDAKNGEAYYSFFDHKKQPLTPEDAGLINDILFEKYDQVSIISHHVEKWEQILGTDTGKFKFIECPLDASMLIEKGFKKFLLLEFENLTWFEPTYLRDFKARNLGIKIKRILNS